MKRSTGGAFPQCCTGSMLIAGDMDNEGGHEFTTDVGRDISLGTCEIVDFTFAVTSNGRLTGRLILGGPCGGGLEVPSKLNNAGSQCVEKPQDILDMATDISDKIVDNSLIMGNISLTLVTLWGV